MSAFKNCAFRQKLKKKTSCKTHHKSVDFGFGFVGGLVRRVQGLEPRPQTLGRVKRGLFRVEHRDCVVAGQLLWFPVLELGSQGFGSGRVLCL